MLKVREPTITLSMNRNSWDFKANSRKLGLEVMVGVTGRMRGMSVELVRTTPAKHIDVNAGPVLRAFKGKWLQGDICSLI